MTSNFALSLSFEGISLLHRVQEGWNLVGETSLDVPDLNGALAQMRADALLLEPDGLRTKLIIPTEQIKFLSLETAQTELNDVMAALDGATPYAVDELVVDFDRSGGRTHIAAVARETLDEAEGFASEHKFNPVGFAALPEPFTFRHEVFFGPVKAADTPQTQRDDTPTAQTGVAVLPSTGEPDTSDAPPPVFTSRAKPTSAAEHADTVADRPTVDIEALPDADSTAEISFSRAVTEDAAVPPAKDAPVAAVEAPTIQQAVPSTAAPKIETQIAEATPKPKSEPLAAPPRAEEVAESGGFISRRKKKEAAPAAAKKQKKRKAAGIVTKQATPARQKPRFLGLILTVILLIFMAIVAFWASTLTEEELSSWFGFNPSQTEVVAVEDPPQTQAFAAEPQADATVAAAQQETPTAPASDNAVATPTPQVRLTETGRILSPSEANRIYAATGVWQRAPRFPFEPREVTLSAKAPDAFIPPVDPVLLTLPEAIGMQPDLALLPPSNPLPPGTDFPRDADGFILATPEGTLTPSGAVVFAGPPPKVPPRRTAPATALSNAPDGVVVISGRPALIPPARPSFEATSEQEIEPNAAEDNEQEPETAQVAIVQPQGSYTKRPALRPNGLVPAVIANADPALAKSRPKLRPAGLAPAPVEEPDPEPAVPDIAAVVGAIADAAPASPFVNVTNRAVRQSSRPDRRPNNFARVVARAQQQQAAQAARTAPAPQTAAAAPRRSSGPVPTTVARAATMDNAIRLRDVNLIGVYGRPNDRRALVRLGNGRYVKVQIGSRLDGGRVSAIGDNALNYVKSGRTLVLQLPDG